LNLRLVMLMSWLLAVLAAPSAHALIFQPRDLYEGEVVVEKQDPAQRDALLEQALAQVMVRVTGDRNAPASEKGQEICKMAVRFVQSFGYGSRPAPAPPAKPEAKPVAGKTAAAAIKAETPPTPNRPIRYFRARFDANALNSQLRAAGFEFWGRERQAVAAWIAVQAEGSRSLIHAGNVDTETPSLQKVAIDRGQPLLVPENKPGSGREILDIVRGPGPGLESAARGMGTNRYVVARISGSGGKWQGEWTLAEEGRPDESWQTTGTSLDETVGAGVHQLTDVLVARHASRAAPSARRTLRIGIGGIENPSDFARVTAYLGNLSAVSNATLSELDGSTAWYQVTLQGDGNALRQIIALGSMLEVAPEDSSGLRYRLVRGVSEVTRSQVSP
jgi:hypothetical protein